MPRILTSNDFLTVPWKNGGGTTVQLYCLENPQNPEDFHLRLSKAQVTQDGPFSDFPGIDRTLLLLEGHGIILNFPDEVEVALENLLQPIHFEGEANIHAKLIAGAVTDFNVMIDRLWGEAQTTLSTAMQFKADVLTVIYDYHRDEIIVLEAEESWERQTSTTLIVVDVQKY